jgi:hypothetical protein
VAIVIGVNPSPNTILTTTKELPQKTMRVNIKNVSKGLIDLLGILDNSRGRTYKDGAYGLRKMRLKLF